MGYRNREVELKLIITRKDKKKTTIKEVNDIIKVLFKKERKQYHFGTSSDTYWHNRYDKAAGDFARLRVYKDLGYAQMTVKGVDKKTNLDRIEIDVNTKEIEKAKLFFNALLGKPAGVVTKHYKVHILENEDTTISVYRVYGDTRIFVETEARTVSRVLALFKKVEKELEEIYNVEVSDKSLYGLYFEKGKK